MWINQNFYKKATINIYRSRSRLKISKQASVGTLLRSVSLLSSPTQILRSHKCSLEDDSREGSLRAIKKRNFSVRK